MHTRTILTALLCGCWCATPATVLAQTSPSETLQQQQLRTLREFQRTQQQAQQQLQRTQQQAQQELTRQLQEARRELEKAAQEVGRVYAEAAGPMTRVFTNKNLRVYTPFSGGRNFLGVVVEDTELGARVTAVTPNGPAASGGVLVGDTIVAIDGVSLVPQPGQPPTSSQTLLSQVANTEPGAMVDLRVLRGGDYRDVEVTMRGEGARWFSYGGSPQIRLWGPNEWTNIFIRSEPWADFEFVALTPALGEYFGTNKGLLIVRAPDDDTLGFRDGDVILDIGGREPQSPEHAFRILGSFAPGEALRVSIMRKQSRQTLEIKIPGGAAEENV
jgi:hypothetical protein